MVRGCLFECQFTVPACHGMVAGAGIILLDGGVRSKPVPFRPWHYGPALTWPGRWACLSAPGLCLRARNGGVAGWYRVDL